MNTLFVIQPYRMRGGIWAFDDDSVGLLAEPFVGETNDMIDLMVIESGQTISKAAKGITIIFGATPFPGHQVKLELMFSEEFGSTYNCSKYKLCPWFCPALFKYFPKAPETLYGMVQTKID